MRCHFLNGLILQQGVLNCRNTKPFIAGRRVGLDGLLTSFGPAFVTLQLIGLPGEQHLAGVLLLLLLFEPFAAFTSCMVVLLLFVVALENLVDFEPLHEFAHSGEVNESEVAFALGVKESEALVDIFLVHVGPESLCTLPKFVLRDSPRLQDQPLR